MVVPAEVAERVKLVMSPMTFPLIPGKDIRLTDRLADLGIDSLTFLEMVVGIEEEFGM